MERKYFLFFGLRESVLGHLLHHIVFCSNMLAILCGDEIISASLAYRATAIYLCVHLSLDDMNALLELIDQEYIGEQWSSGCSRLKNYACCQMTV